jgi:outer membrane protein insertion porin family
VSVAAAAALTVTLHLPGVQRQLIPIWQRAASSALGGPVTVTALHFNLWTGHVRAGGLHLVRPGLEITSADLEVQLSLRRGVVMRATEPRIVVTLSPDSGPTPHDARPWTILDRFAAIDVARGALRIQRADGSDALQIDGFEMRATRHAGALTATVVAGAIGFRGGEYTWREAVDARIDVELPDATRTVHVRAAEIAVGQTRVQLTGELHQLNPVIGSAHVEVPAGMSLLRTLLPDMVLDGEIGARADLVAGRSGPRATVVVDGRAVRLAQVGPWDGRIAAHVEGDVLRVDDIDLLAYGGRIRGEGVFPLDGSTSEFTARLRGVDLPRVLSSHTDSTVRVASHADADLALRLSRWDPQTLVTDGTVTFRPVAGPGIPLRGSARFSANDRRVRVSVDRLFVRDADLRVHGTIGLDGAIDLRYGVRLADVSRAPAALADFGVELPAVNIRGALAAEGTVSGPLERWVARASLVGRPFAIEDLDLDLESELRLTPTSLQLVSLSATGVDGVVSASGDVPLRESDEWMIAGTLETLRLDDVLARHGVPFDATSRGRFEVTGQRREPEVALAIEADASSPAAAADGAAGEIRIDTSARASRRGVVVDRFTAHGGTGTLDGDGRWSAENGRIDARVRAAEFPLTAIPGASPLPDLQSMLSGQLQISGTLPAPEARGYVSATHTAWRGSPLPDLRVDLTSDGRQVTLEGRLEQMGLFTGQMPLVRPWPLHLDVDLAALPMTEVMRVFPRLAKHDASAALMGRAGVDVEFGSPASVRYEVRVESAEGSFTQPWKTGAFSVRGTPETVSIQDLEMQFGFGRLRIDGQIGLDQETSSRLTVAGSAPLSYLALLTPVEEAGGEALVDVTLTGSLARPSGAGTLRVGGGLVRLGAVRLDELELLAAMDERGVAIRQASARVAGGHIRATGAVALEPSSDRYRLELHGKGIDAGQFLAPRDDGATLTALVDADLRIVSDQLSLEAVRGEGSLTSMALSVSGRTLGLEAPVALSVRSGALTHSPLRLKGSGGSVTIESAVARKGGEIHIAVNVDGEVDLVVANPLLDDAASLSGRARVQGRVERDAGGWHARGDARVNGGRIVIADPAVVISSVTATLRAEGGRIEVVEGAARMGDGALAITGQVLMSRNGPEVDLALRADRVPLEYPTGVRTRSSGDLRLTGRSGAYRLAGEVVVHRAVSELDDVRAAPGVDRVSAALAAFEGRGSLRDRTTLDVLLRLEDGLRMATPQISLIVDGAVRVGGTLLTPELGGSLIFREGGTVRVSRALVRLESGRVELSGYPARPPEVDVRGTTQVSGVGIDVSLSGSLDDVRMTLAARTRSDLTQGDLATLILTGRTTSAAASESGAILAEELASSLGRVVNRQLGGFVMFDLSRDESLIPENTNSSLRMNVGIPLGNRLYVIYSHRLDTGALRWIVDFQPGGEFRLRLITNDDGSTAVEASHRFSFDVWSRRLRPPVVRVRQRIGTVTVVGATSSEETQLRSRVRLAPGDQFDHFRTLDAARRAQAWYVAEGFLEAAVDVHTEMTAGDTVDLTVHVVRGPLVTIDWRGDTPSRSLRRHVTEGWNSVLPRDERAARLAREVRRTLQSSRYFDAAVTATVTEVAGGNDQSYDQVRVSFDVARGPRAAGVDLRFEGNINVPQAILADALPARNSPAFFAMLEPEGSRRLAGALRVPYATEGFLDMRVGTPEESFAGAGERLRVTVPIVEGDRAQVVALELPGEVLDAGGGARALALRAGAPFRLDAYTADRARLQAWLRDNGYPDARVTSVLEPGPGGIAVRFQADAGPRVTMGDVRTARDGRTRQTVLENAVAISPGDPIRASRLDLTRQRLNDTRVFRSADLRLAPIEGREDVRDVVIDVVERSDINVEYSLRYTTAGEAQVGGAPSESQAGLQVGAGLELVSPFGAADRYRVSGLIGSERQLINARYDRSTFFKWHVPTELFLYDDRTRVAEDGPGLAERVIGATFEQSRGWRSGIDGRRLHERLRMQWGYTVKRVDYAESSQGDSTISGLRAGLIHSIIGDTRDTITDPQRGMLWSIGSELALKRLGSDVNYYRTFGQFYLFVPLLPRLTWAQGYRIGVVPGSDPTLLLDNRFFAGGAASVRGFAERSLGPLTSDGVPIGGQASAVVNQELRFPLWKRLHAGVFYDAGNAFALASDFDLFSLRQSAGAGLRLMFPFGPVRLDWAQVIDRQEGEKPSRFIFSIGHAF